MDLTDKLRPGMRVIGPDDHDYGSIERYDGTAVYLDGRAVPFSAVERVDDDRLQLSVAGAYDLIEQGSVSAGTDGRLQIPVVEERLEVSTRQIDLGEILVHKTVDEVEEVRQETLHREDVQIERVRVNRRVSVPEERRQEGDWLIIPVMEEVFVVQKQLVVTEEIRIRKQLVAEEREIHGTVRRERASIEDTRAQHPPTAPARREATRPPDDDRAWDGLRDTIRGDDL
jgi:uncharacterized protein (TIGR02271 family)